MFILCLSVKIFNDGSVGFKDFFQPNHLLSILVLQMSGAQLQLEERAFTEYCVPKNVLATFNSSRSRARDT